MGEKNKNIQKKSKRVLDLGKMPSGFVTVDDVIGVNDINGALSEVQENRSDIDALVVIWRDNEGCIHWRSAKAKGSEIVSMCEVTKQHCIDITFFGKDE